MSLFRRFSSTLNPDEHPSAPATAHTPHPPAAEMFARLDGIARLLITPTPAAVREACLLLGDVQSSPTFRAALKSPRDHTREAARLQAELKRVQCLAEGALRVQWGRMRRAKAVTEYYVPGGRVFHWHPVWPNLDIKV